MKLKAFGASTSKSSINQQLAIYTASQFENAEIEILNLNDYALPLYSIDAEQASGVPANAIAFYDKLQQADLIVISLAEHNGTYTAAFKNLFDWMSRHKGKTFANNKMFLLSTSPGGRGGLGVMEAALAGFPFHGAEILAHFCLPFFQKNFDAEKGIQDEALKAGFEAVLAAVKSKL